MAIAYGAISAVGTTSTPTAVTLSGTNTIGIVYVAGDTTADNITDVTWGAGNVMFKIAVIQTPTDRYTSVWWIANPTSGATITFTGGSFWRSYSFYYTGAAQTGQADSSNTGTSTASTAITVATTVVATDCWYVMCQKDITGGRVYTPSGVLVTTRKDTDDGGLAIADSAGTVGTGSQSGTMTQTALTSNHGGIAFSLAPAGGAAAPEQVHSNLLTLGVG